MRPKNQQVDRYKNPDNDPRGPYVLVDITTSRDRPSLRYEWHGVLPPKGRSWKFNEAHAELLYREGKIIFSSSGLPWLKRYLHQSQGELQDLLHGLSGKKFEREVDFARGFVPRFAEVLDYDEQETFYEYGGNQYRADVVLSSSIESKPWIVLELKNSKSMNVDRWLQQLRHYLDAFDCRTGVVISPDVLILTSDGEVQQFDLQSLTSEQVQCILVALERGAQSLSPPPKAPGHSMLVDLIEAVETASTNAEKGKSLEALARFLFDSTPSLKSKYLNLQTRSSEIDLVIEYDRSKGAIPLFDELGRYCLVECKNWSEPVGVGPVRDFMGKLDKCKIKLGVIFSKNGVTGVDAGVDALREIQSRFDRDGLYLLVFSLDDLRSIGDGEEFNEALDQKADSLRFDSN